MNMSKYTDFSFFLMLFDGRHLLPMQISSYLAWNKIAQGCHAIKIHRLAHTRQPLTTLRQLNKNENETPINSIAFGIH